jgi:hypothetical protein
VSVTREEVVREFDVELLARDVSNLRSQLRELAGDAGLRLYGEERTWTSLRRNPIALAF